MAMTRFPLSFPAWRWCPGAGLAGVALAQGYPERPIKFVIPHARGAAPPTSWAVARHWA